MKLREKRRFDLIPVLVVALIVTTISSTNAGALEIDPTKKKPGSGEKKITAISPQQAVQSMVTSERGGEGDIEANDETPRGPAAEVYPVVAPSVVLVRAGGGHGTGFIVDASGWIVTNHHVIDGADIDVGTGYRFCKVNIGYLEDGLMQLVEEPLIAIVYSASEQKDLALLQLVDVPSNIKLTPIKLATKPALPGSDCIAIGHPTRGALWTIRDGKVANIHDWPKDTIDSVMARLTLAGSEKDKFMRAIAAAPVRKVVISTCGINPGDSGGPLVNEDGELIAITFAIPTGGSEQGISLDKFSYHVHLSELREFIRKRPGSPELFVPDPWPVARVGQLSDDDKNGKDDTWYFALEDGGDPTGFLIDIDENTDPKFREKLESQEMMESDFDYEFSMQMHPARRTFYDTDNNGNIDLIFTDADGDNVSDLTIKLVGNAWSRIDMKDQNLLDASLFTDPDIGKRFVELMQPPANDEAAADAPAEK